MNVDTDNQKHGWIITFFLAILIGVSFFAGMFSTSHTYDDRYPTEYNWWVDHQSHYPGVIVSSSFENTSCKQSGNVRPPHGENVTQIQWIGGEDAGFVGNFKIVYDDETVIVPAPTIGKCIYIFNSTGKIIVYGQDITSGGWTKLGSGNSSGSS
jgi:hypothetical protein